MQPWQLHPHDNRDSNVMIFSLTNEYNVKMEHSQKLQFLIYFGQPYWQQTKHSRYRTPHRYFTSSERHSLQVIVFPQSVRVAVGQA